MVYVLLKNKGGQVVKDIKLKDPEGKTWIVTGTSRKGINRYSIGLKSSDGSSKTVMNHDIARKKDPNHKPWSVVGDFHTPAEISKMFGRKLDPDANKPRHLRKSFWQMKSKPGTHNYRQKQRLMRLAPDKYSNFKEDWESNLVWLHENNMLPDDTL